MKSSEFKELKNLLSSLLENKHNTFVIYRANYIFHDNETRYSDDTKNGVIVIFGLTDIQIKTILLYGLKTENGTSRYTDSKELSNDLYHVTPSQKDILINLVEENVKLITDLI